MKKTISLFLILVFILSSFAFDAVLAENSSVIFEDNFSSEGAAWTASGCSVSDDKAKLYTTNMCNLKLGNNQILFYNPYEVEFDATPISFNGTTEHWISFNAGGANIFFRVAAGTVHAQTATGETSVGIAKMELGKTYRIKASVGKGFVAVYYKDALEQSFREVGIYAKNDTFENPFQIGARNINYEVDNVKIYSLGGDVAVKEKVIVMNVGDTQKIEFDKSADVIFESADSAIATVDAYGTITAQKTGSVVINIKNTNGEIVEAVLAKVVVLPTNITFKYTPDLAYIPKDSVRYDEEKIILSVGEFCDLRATIPSNTTLKGMEWTTDKEGIIELWGTSPYSQTRVITALTPGEVTLTAKSKYNEAKDSIVIRVISLEEADKIESQTFTFVKTSKNHAVNDNIAGVHIMMGDFVEHEVDTGAFLDAIGIKAYRGGMSAIQDSYVDKNSGETKESLAYKIAREHDKACVFSLNFAEIESPEHYDSAIQEYANQLKRIKSTYDGQLYIELFNEVYAISAQSKLPKTEDYVEFCKKLIPELKKIDPNAVFMACGMYYASYLDITYDEGNFVATGVGDPAFTQGYRVKHWNEQVKQLVDEGYCQGITLHPYQSTGTYLDGMTTTDIARAKIAAVDMNLFGNLWDQRFFDYKADFYFTEWGQLQGSIYWGIAANDPAERKRYNLQKYPFTALCNMKSMLTYAQLGNVEAAHFHSFYGTDGFGVFDTKELEKIQSGEYKIPNTVVFEKMSSVFEANDNYYEITPVNMNYTTIPRPWWNGGKAEQISVADVDAWGFGNADELKEVAFFNQTSVPQTVKLDGAALKPTWSYGGEADKVLPEWLKNESWPSWANMISNHSKPELFLIKPDTHKDAQSAQELVIPPYTMMFAEVTGNADTSVVTTKNTVSAIAGFALKNSLVLGVGEQKAYVDNIERSIDENPAVVPVVENGRTLLPLRFIAESLGCDVTYDDITKVVTVKNKNTDITLTIGYTKYNVNGEEKEFDVPATVQNGRTLLPLRALAEALGKDVYWDDRGYIFIGTKTYSVDTDIKYYFDEIEKLYK